MRKAVPLFVLAAILLGSVPVLADGAFYWTESIPPEIPYQRALLLFNGSQETLVVQSKYRLSSSATDDFGWVVPMPSVPEVASIGPDVAEELFFWLSQTSAPAVTRFSDCLYPIVSLWLMIAPIAGILLLLLLLASFVIRPLQPVRSGWKKVAGTSIILLFTSAVGLFLLALSGGAMAGVDSVDVIWEEQVGIYNVQVVRAGEAGDLIQWLNENRFQFDEEDTQVFDEYVRRSWCFVVARVDPVRSAHDKIITEGLVAPLILRFETDAPVYPLALTGTAGHNTQVVLYVLGKHKWQTDGRLALKYAGKAHIDEIERMCREAVPDLPEACLDDAVLPYLSKFKGTLTPAQMEEDLVLEPAEDNEAYREQIVQW